MADNRLFTGTVLVSLPEIGCAVVADDTAPVSKHAALLPYPCGHAGAGAFQAVKSGDRVLCTTLYGQSTDLLGIVCPVNSTLDELVNSYSHRRINNPSRFAQAWKKLLANWSVAMKMLPESARDFLLVHANGVDGDMLPGDFDIRDKLTGTGIHVGRGQVCLSGSALSTVSVTEPDSRVRISGAHVSIDTPAGETAYGFDWNVRNTAVSACEAFGLKSGAALSRDGENLEPASQTSVPLYRLQHSEGSPVDGSESSVVDFPHETDEHNASGGSEPSMLSVRRQGLSGDLVDASALGTLSVKTPVVLGATQLGYGTEPLAKTVRPDGYGLAEASGMDDLREPYRYTETADAGEPSASEEDMVTDAALNKLIDSLLSGPYNSRVRKIMADRGFGTASAGRSVRSRIKEESAISGSTYRQQYPLPASIEITDPVSGDAHRYYDSMSFISQEPDGSICIADGYGSEIRMCRGNIYISPALDLIMRPGRDMSSMVPGDTALNSQGRFDISSGKDSIGIRAVKDLRMAAGASDDPGALGQVVIENLSAAGGDIVVTSPGAVSVTAGTGMAIGRRPSSSGISLTIDAGLEGSLYGTAGSATIESAETVLGGLQTSGSSVSGSAIALHPGYISVLANVVNMPARVCMQKAKTATSVGVVRSGRRTQASVDTAGNGDLIVGGSIIANRQLFVNGLCYAKSVAGVSVSEVPAKSFKPYEVKDNPGVPSSAGDSAAAAAEATALSVCSEEYLASCTFTYPETFGITVDAIPGMRWQEMSKASGIPGPAWEEPAVNGTYAYPGKAVWETATVTEPGYRKTAGLNNGGYITNNGR